MLEPSFALGEYLGLDVETPAPGSAVARLDADVRHQNPFGSVHGAVVFAMVDTAMGAAVLSLLDAGDRCATHDIQLRFLQSASTGPIEAHVAVTSHHRRRMVLDARVTGDDGRVLAVATGEFAVLAPR